MVKISDELLEAVNLSDECIDALTRAWAEASCRCVDAMMTATPAGASVVNERKGGVVSQCENCGGEVFRVTMWVTGSTVLVDAAPIEAVVVDETMDPDGKRTGRTESVFVRHWCGNKRGRGKAATDG